MERMRNGWWQAGSVSTLTGYGMTLPAIRVSQMRLPEISLPPLTRNQAECGPASLSLLRSPRSEEHTSELQSRLHLVCRLLLEKKKQLHTHTCLTLPHTLLRH